jgi:hypothetical protein
MLGFSEASISPPRSSALMVTVAVYGNWVLKRGYLGVGCRLAGA